MNTLREGVWVEHFNYATIKIIYSCPLARPISFKVTDPDKIYGRVIGNIIMFSSPRDDILKLTSCGKLVNNPIIRMMFQTVYHHQRDGVLLYLIKYSYSFLKNVVICRSITTAVDRIPYNIDSAHVRFQPIYETELEVLWKQ